MKGYFCKERGGRTRHFCRVTVVDSYFYVMFAKEAWETSHFGFAEDNCVNFEMLQPDLMYAMLMVSQTLSQQHTCGFPLPFLTRLFLAKNLEAVRVRLIFHLVDDHRQLRKPALFAEGQTYSKVRQNTEGALEMQIQHLEREPVPQIMKVHWIYPSLFKSVIIWLACVL